MNRSEQVKRLKKSEIRHLISKIRECATELLADFHVNDFKAIVGIDCSGRLPAFILWRILKEIYGTEAPPLYFLMVFKPQYAPRAFYTDPVYEQNLHTRLKELQRHILPNPGSKLLMVDDGIVNATTFSAVLPVVNAVFPQGVTPVLITLNVYLPGIPLSFRKRYRIYYPSVVYNSVSVNGISAHGVNKTNLKEGRIYPNVNHDLSEAARVRRAVLQMIK